MSMKTKSLLIVALGVLSGNLSAKDYLLSTPNTSLLITANPGENQNTNTMEAVYQKRIFKAFMTAVWLLE